jgi:hypothetical protein
VLSFVSVGKPVDALTGYVAGGNYERALTYGMEQLHNLLALPPWSLDEALALIRPLHSINLATVLPQQGAAMEIKNQFLVYSYFLGAQQAMNKGAGYASVVSFLFDAVHQLLQRLQQSGAVVSFPLPSALLKLQEASFFQLLNPQRSLALLKEVESGGSAAEKSSAASGAVAKLKAAAQQLQKTVQTLHATPAGQAVSRKLQAQSQRNQVIPAGSQLPTAFFKTKTFVKNQICKSCSFFTNKRFLKKVFGILHDELIREECFVSGGHRHTFVKNRQGLNKLKTLTSS